MGAYRIQVELSDLLSLSGAIETGAFKNISMAVERIAMAGAERWKAAALRAKLWPKEAQAYADSVSYRMTGPFSATISATYKYVEDIENGRPARDLKAMLNTSNKVRTNKKGQRYLFIPISHQVPGSSSTGGRAMPESIYLTAKELPATRIVGSGKRLSATGKVAPTQKYRWGGRLPEGLAPKLKEGHATDPYASMYRFTASSGKSGRYSKYLTFRTMGEWQTGAWIVPAQPGQKIAAGVVEGLRTDAETIFRAAASADVQSLTG